MKKALKLCLISLSLLSLASCSDRSSSTSYAITKKDEYSTEDIYNLLERTQKGYHVEGKVEQKTTFPDAYSSYNTKSSESISRDYGYLKDGITPSVNVYSNDVKTTYYKGEDGKLTAQYYTYDNKVDEKQVLSGSLTYYFDKVYKDPFKYLSYKDFSSKLELPAKKGNLILEQYFDIDVEVSSISFSVNDDSSISANFDVEDKTCGYIVSSEGGVVEYTISTEVELTFSFDENISFDTIEPSTNSNENLKHGLSNLKDNYTLLLSSPNASTTVGYYLTSEGVLEVANANQSSISVGDIFYKKNGNSYTKFTYNPGTVVDWEQGNNVSLDEILPDYTKVSDAIFEQLSSNSYILLEPAKTYVPYYLTPADYQLNENAGISGTISLDSSNNISQISLKLSYSGSTVTYNENFANLGSTTFPSYFDASSSDFDL